MDGRTSKDKITIEDMLAALQRIKGCADHPTILEPKDLKRVVVPVELGAIDEVLHKNKILRDAIEGAIERLQSGWDIDRTAEYLHNALRRTSDGD